MMKKLRNTSGKRLNFPIRGSDGKRLRFEVGEEKFVTAATVKHPAVSTYIGKGLQLVEDDSSTAPKTKELEVEAPPAPPKTPEPEPTSENEPSTDEEPGDTEEPADAKNAVTDDLRELYLSAPGITDENVDAILEAFPTVAAIADASRDILVEAGVTLSYAKRLRNWARSQ